MGTNKLFSSPCIASSGLFVPCMYRIWGSAVAAQAVFASICSVVVALGLVMGRVLTRDSNMVGYGGVGWAWKSVRLRPDDVKCLSREARLGRLRVYIF